MDQQPATPAAQPSQQPQQLTMIDLEEYTKNSFTSATSLQDEVKKAREMYKDGFENNPTFHEHKEKVKEAQKALASVRVQISKSPDMAALNQKVKDLSFDLKEKKASLGSYAMEFTQVAGTDQIEINGQVYTIVKSAKLVKHRSKRQ